jgi:hypothetical protein
MAPVISRDAQQTLFVYKAVVALIVRGKRESDPKNQIVPSKFNKIKSG